MTTDVINKLKNYTPISVISLCTHTHAHIYWWCTVPNTQSSFPREHIFRRYSDIVAGRFSILRCQKKLSFYTSPQCPIHFLIRIFPPMHNSSSRPRTINFKFTFTSFRHLSVLVFAYYIERIECNRVRYLVFIALKLDILYNLRLIYFTHTNITKCKILHYVLYIYAIHDKEICQRVHWPFKNYLN